MLLIKFYGKSTNFIYPHYIGGRSMPPVEDLKHKKYGTVYYITGPNISYKVPGMLL